MSEKRTNIIPGKYTDTEKQILTEKAKENGLKLSTYMREILYKGIPELQAIKEEEE